MIRVSAHGRTQKAASRDENQDGFGIYPELGLHVVVDAFGSALPVSRSLEAFERAIRECLRDGKLDGALTTAGRFAQLVLRANAGAMGRIGAEFAALWLHDGWARVAWSGSCRIYRVRDDTAELLTGEWHDARDGDVLGGPRFQMLERFSRADEGDTFILATDGFFARPIELERLDMRRTDVEELTCALVALATSGPAPVPDDDLAVVCARLEEAPSDV